MKKSITIAIILAFISIAPLVFAVPATINLTPTDIVETTAGGDVDRYELYESCDMATQTTGLSLGTIALDQVISFQGDTDEQYTVCARAINVVGIGAFDNTVTIVPPQPPGATRIELNCSIDLANGTAPCSVTSN